MFARIALATLLAGPAFAQWSAHSFSPARAHTAVEAVGDRLLIAGGWPAGGGVFYDDIDVLDLRTGAWSKFHLSEPRRAVTSVVRGEQVFLAGGRSAPPGFSDTVDIFDLATGSISSATLSVPRHWMATAQVGSKVIFAGGTDIEPNTHDAVDVYDGATGTWSSTVLDQPRYGIAAATVGELALFAGGRRYSGESKRVDIYDDSTGTWSTTVLSVARFEAVAVTVGTQVLIVGGFLSPGTASGLVDIYDHSTGGWSVASILPRHSMGVAVIGDIAVFAGGSLTTWGPMTDVVDIYNASTGTWSTATLSEARSFPRLTTNEVDRAPVVGTRAFFMGGRTDACAESDRVDIFDAATGVWSTDLLPGPRLGHTAVSGSRVALAGGYGACSGTSSFVDVFDATVGAPYCVAQPANSTGFAADLRLAGSDLAGGWPLTVRATQLPPGQFGLLLTSQAQAALPGASGTLGTLCLGSPIGRFIDGAGPANSLGVLDVAVDTLALPVSGGVAAQTGETWSFQLWYRDQGGVTNVSRAWELLFQ